MAGIDSVFDRIFKTQTLAALNAQPRPAVAPANEGDVGTISTPVGTLPPQPMQTLTPDDLLTHFEKVVGPTKATASDRVTAEQPDTTPDLREPRIIPILPNRDEIEGEPRRIPSRDQIVPIVPTTPRQFTREKLNVQQASMINPDITEFVSGVANWVKEDISRTLSPKSDDELTSEIDKIWPINQPLTPYELSHYKGAVTDTGVPVTRIDENTPAPTDWEQAQNIIRLVSQGFIPNPSTLPGELSRVNPEVMKLVKAGLGKVIKEETGAVNFGSKGAKPTEGAANVAANAIPPAEPVKPPAVEAVGVKGGAVPPVEPPKVPPAATGVTPPQPPVDKLTSMWKKGRQGQPIDATDTWRKFMEQVNDATFGVRSMKPKGDIIPGGEKDVATLLNRVSGVANAGATRYVLAVEEMKRIAPNVIADDINSIIYANHAKEILAVKGQGRVMAGGFKSAAELDDQLKMISQRLGDTEFAKANQAAEVVKRTYNTELKRLVDEGIIDKDVGDELLAKYPWYNPLKYVEDAEALAKSGKSAKPFTVISSGLKRLTEEGTAKAAISPLDVLPEQLVANEVRIHKNQLAKAIIQVGLDDPKLGIVRGGTYDTRNTLSFFENGKRQVYKVPDWMYREAITLTETMKNPLISLIGSLNGISRAAFTTASPPFVISNMLNDALTAFISRGILPTETGAALIRSLRGLEKDPIMQSFRLAGGYQQRFYGKDLAKEIIKNGGKPLQPNETLGQKILKFIPEAGEAGEQAPRMALFKRQLNETLPNWKRMTPEQIAATPQGRKAAADAVELTINFGRGGYLVKSANPAMLFLNATMEGIKLPFRALRDNPNARWRLAGAGAVATGLAAYNMSYPEYFDIPNNIRWGSIPIMLPSKERDAQGNPKPNYVTIIPRTREWGAFLGPITYAMEKMFSDSPTDFGTFASTMAPQLSPISSIPSPEVLKELFEQSANWDYYKSQPIIPKELENVPAEQQVEPWVSPTIAKIAQGAGASPLRVQHAYDGLLGGAGRTFTSVADWITSLISPTETDPRIEGLVEQFQAIEDKDMRQQFLNNLDYKDRDALNEQMRQPQKGLPVVSAIGKRVMPGLSGQLARTGQDLAAKKTGVSVEQTKSASSILRKTSEELQILQEQSDSALKSGAITLPDWREKHKEQAIAYRGALIAAGVSFPSAAQVQKDPSVWTKYKDSVATLADSMADRRAKGDILVAGYRAIQPTEIMPGIMDWQSFYKQRDEFRNGLVPENKKLLDDTIKAYMTPIEKMTYDASQNENLSRYFNLPEGIQREAMRVTDPKLDADLNLMGVATSAKTPQSLKVVKSKANELAIPVKSIPALGEEFKDYTGKVIYKAKDTTDEALWNDGLSFLPQYYREYLWDKGGWTNPELNSRISYSVSQKEADKQKIENYGMVNEFQREQYRAQNPEVDVALNIWGLASTIKSAKALAMLKTRATELGIPFDALPISPNYKKKQAQTKQAEAKAARAAPQTVDFMSDKLAKYGIK